MEVKEMCKESLEFQNTEKIAVGQSLVVKDIMSIHNNRSVLGFGLVNDPEEKVTGQCQTGVCIEDGWGLAFTLTPLQIESLELCDLFQVSEIGDESGATLFARFIEGEERMYPTQHEDDLFCFEYGGDKVQVPFGSHFTNVKARVMVASGDDWPPNEKRDVFRRSIQRSHAAPVLAG